MAQAPAARPFILVLAGVNGAGKSSVGGAMVESAGLTWYNPDQLARELLVQLGIDQPEANALAWQHGREQLEDAIKRGRNHAFETTLGANTIPSLLAQAARTHDVVMIFVGLASPEQHIARVRLRVAQGGHPIPEQKIRERWTTSRANLVTLLPHLARLQVFDNSAEAAIGHDIPQPMRVLEMQGGHLKYPDPADPVALARTPAWARAVVQAAVELG
jgi:predicted ABC-type ATPase